MIKQFYFKQFNLAYVVCFLQHYWSLTIRLFRVISETLVGVGYRTAQVDWAITIVSYIFKVEILKYRPIFEELDSPTGGV